MALLNPYLNFDDNTREAMEFYQSVFGGELDVNTFSDFGMTDAPADGVMHSQLTTDAGFTLMASDTPAEFREGQTPNGHISLSGDEDEMLRGYFDRLAEGGTIDVPLEVAPWGDAFGQVKDRFGVNWLVNIAGAGQG